MSLPPPYPWISPLSALTNYLFPPLPSGTPSTPQGAISSGGGPFPRPANTPQTAAYGQQGASYGVYPSALTTTPNVSFGQTMVPSFSTANKPSPIGGGTVRAQGTRTTAQTSTPPPTMPLGYFTSPLSPSPTPAPTYGTTSTATPTIGGGTEGGNMGDLTYGTVGYDSAGNKVRDYGNYATNAQGDYSQVTVSDEQRWADGMTTQQMQELGYTYNQDTRSWSLNPGPASASSNTWYGQNFKVGGGYKAPIMASSFRTAQAYNTWLNRKKKDAKKEQTEGMKQAQSYVTSNYGTG